VTDVRTRVDVIDRGGQVKLLLGHGAKAKFSRTGGSDCQDAAHLTTPHSSPVEK
jgi:hypothetical protein